MSLIAITILNYSNFVFMEGFKDGVNACCGSGPYGGVFSCGGTKKVIEYFSLCDNVGEYVYIGFSSFPQFIWSLFQSRSYVNFVL